MFLRDIDIVYFVKESTTNNELRYSLRSVEKNFPHHKVWIYGGKPRDITGDEHIRVVQNGVTKWDKVRNMYSLMASNDAITEDFVLFNDDFFIMQPIDELPILYRCSLPNHIITNELAYGDKINNYTRQLRRALKTLRDNNLPEKSYELHVPMLFNRKKLLELIEKFPDIRCTRSLYGNYYHIGGRKSADVKVFSATQNFDKDSAFLSTEDYSFAAGAVGKFIRNEFPHKSRFEDRKK